MKEMERKRQWRERERGGGERKGEIQEKDRGEREECRNKRHTD